MSFLHFCNNCASTKKQVHLFLTCGHILCKACARPNKKKVCKCVVCDQLSGSRALGKLPDHLKQRLFTSNIGSLFAEPLKVVKFQQQQQDRAFRNFIKYRDGIEKNNKLLEKELAEIKQLEAEAVELTARRIKKQQQLAKVCEEQQQEKAKQPAHQYRDPQRSLEIDSPSSSSSSSSPGNFSFDPTINSPDFSFLYDPPEEDFFESGNNSKRRASIHSPSSLAFNFNINLVDSGHDSGTSPLFSFDESPKSTRSKYSSRSPFFA